MSKHNEAKPTRNSHPSSPDAADNASGDTDETERPDSPTTKGDGPLPEELTGRASKTDEDLVALMANGSAEHLSDGFRSGNGDDPDTDPDLDDDEEIDLT